jgi:2-oxoisovalerate dehydrogenase E1 component
MIPADDQRLEAYRRMVRARRFDEAAVTLHKRGEIPGAIHASIGQEATAVGICLALGPDDYLSGNHRSHAHPIAKGAALGPLMAELLGRADGVCRGKGGSMHLADVSIGSLGESGIVGAGLPVATGAGLGAQVLGQPRVSVCFFGDGAANQGTFHESLNLAAIWSLPVVYVCENNRYAATTPSAAVSAVASVAERAAAYAIPAVTVDGQDLDAVLAAGRAAVARARAGDGPTVIECLTYRFREHAEGLPIPADYRDAHEVETWSAQRDPLVLYRARLLEEGAVDAATLEHIDAEVAAEVADAVAFARASPVPDPASAFEDLWATPIARTPAPPVAVPENGDHESIYLLAAAEGIVEELRRDDRVILLGEDIALYIGRDGLEEFGPRVRATPISENGFVGAAIGAALVGCRPIVELSIASFLLLATEQVVHQAAKLRTMTGGQVRVPAVFRVSMWHNGANAAHHADRPYPMFMNVPGLKIAVPSTPWDAKGLLKAAVRDDDPVLVFEDNDLWLRSGPVGGSDDLVPFGQAAVRRRGRDVTVVGISANAGHALAAAEQLGGEGIDVEVIDPRTLVPLDTTTILESVARTGRLVIADAAHRTCSAASEIAALAAEEVFESLRAPVVRVTTPDVQIPFSPALERPLYPDAERIAAAVRRVTVGLG